VVRLLYGGGFVSAAVPLVLLTIGAFLAVVAGQVNQLMLICGLERSALMLNVAWLVAWVTLGLACGWLGGVVAASAFALTSGVAYAAAAAGLLAAKRNIYSFLRLPIRLIA
jgi:O-antigen/teichoic acid export membrane protein